MKNKPLNKVCTLIHINSPRFENETNLSPGQLHLQMENTGQL